MMTSIGLGQLQDQPLTGQLCPLTYSVPVLKNQTPGGWNPTRLKCHCLYRSQNSSTVPALTHGSYFYNLSSL